MITGKLLQFGTTAWHPAVPMVFLSAVLQALACCIIHACCMNIWPFQGTESTPSKLAIMHALKKCLPSLCGFVVAEQHASNLRKHGPSTTQKSVEVALQTIALCLSSCIASKCVSHSVGDCGVDADGNDQICNARISISAQLRNEKSMSDNTIGVCVTPLAAGSACISGYGRPNCPSSTHH